MATSLEFLDSVIEYDIKLILLFGTIIMAFISFYISSKLDRNEDLSDMLYYFMRSFSWIVVVFAPLFSLILLRSVPLTTIITIMIGFYSVFLSGFTLFFVYWLGKRFLEKYFKIQFGEKNREQRTVKDYRRYD